MVAEVKKIAKKNRYTGISLVEGAKIGNTENGEKSQVSMDPPTIEPRLRIMVGAIRKFSLFLLVELVEEKDGDLKTNIVSRAEYMTVRRVAKINIIIIREFVLDARADSIIVSFE